MNGLFKITLGAILFASLTAISITKTSGGDSCSCCAAIQEFVSQTQPITISGTTVPSTPCGSSNFTSVQAITINSQIIATNVPTDPSTGAYSYTLNRILPAGLYTFVVTDSNGLTDSANVTIAPAILNRGVVNTAFGNATPANGIASSPIQGFSSAVVINSANDITVAGITNTNTLGLVQFSSSGAVNTAFNFTDNQQLMGGFSNLQYLVAINSNYIIAATSSTNSGLLLSYTSTGAADTFFNTNALSNPLNNPRNFTSITGLQLIGTDMYVVGMSSANTVLIQHYDLNGNFINFVSVPGTNPLIATSDTDVYLSSINASNQVVVAQYSNNLALINSSITAIANAPHLDALAVASNSKPILVYDTFTTQSTYSVAQFNSDLSIDTAFTANTQSAINSNFGGAIITAVIVEQSGNIDVSGSFSSTGDIFAASFTPDGTLDTTFNSPHGFNDVPMPGEAIALALNSSGQLIAALRNSNLAAIEFGTAPSTMAITRATIIPGYTITSPVDGMSIGAGLLPLSIAGNATPSTTVTVTATNTTTSQVFTLANIAVDASGFWNTTPTDFTAGNYEIELLESGMLAATATCTVSLTAPAAPTIESTPTAAAIVIPTIEGRATPGSTITLAQAALVLGSTIADADGNWSFGLSDITLGGIQPISSFSVGGAQPIPSSFTVSLFARAFNRLGNISAPSATITGTVSSSATTCGTNTPTTSTTLAVTCPATGVIPASVVINNPLFSLDAPGATAAQISIDVLGTDYAVTSSLTPAGSFSFLFNQGSVLSSPLTITEVDPSGTTTSIDVPVEFTITVNPGLLESPIARAIRLKYCS